MAYKRPKVSMARINSSIQQIRTIQELRDQQSRNPKMAPVKIDLARIRDDYPTPTSQLQHETESTIIEHYESATEEDHCLKRKHHIAYLRSMLGRLPGAFRSLDASRPWMIYWAANALSLLGDDISDLKSGISDSLLACQSATGGFGGNNGQLAHLAPTYAAVTGLALTDDPNTWDKIDREGMYSFLMEMKQPNGSFTMHRGGEVDTRASYCALAIASLLNLLTPELVENTPEFIRSCQTYEGGFSSIPGTEAHGGYAFCALAALCIVGRPCEMLNKYIDLSQFTKWLSSRQFQPEKGFSGRTNKLVDGCYNHWVGGCWALIENAIEIPGTEPGQQIWDRVGLQNYTLVCCQERRGGLRDKPGKRPDAYHTNYTLAGLSGAQYTYSFNGHADDTVGDYAFRWASKPCKNVSVSEDDKVMAMNPVHVLPEGTAERMHHWSISCEKV